MMRRTRWSRWMRSRLLSGALAAALTPGLGAPAAFAFGEAGHLRPLAAAGVAGGVAALAGKTFDEELGISLEKLGDVARVAHGDFIVNLAELNRRLEVVRELQRAMERSPNVRFFLHDPEATSADEVWDSLAQLNKRAQAATAVEPGKSDTGFAKLDRALFNGGALFGASHDSMHTQLTAAGLSGEPAPTSTTRPRRPSIDVAIPGDMTFEEALQLRGLFPDHVLNETGGQWSLREGFAATMKGTEKPLALFTPLHEEDVVAVQPTLAGGSTGAPTNPRQVIVESVSRLNDRQAAVATDAMDKFESRELFLDDLFKFLVTIGASPDDIDRYIQSYLPNYYLSLSLQPEDARIVREMVRDYDYRSRGRAAPSAKLWFLWGVTWAKMALEKAAASGTANRTVVIARDTRKIEPTLIEALVTGITSLGLNVVIIGTKESPNAVSSYSWAATHYRPLMGILVTSSHVTSPPEIQIRGAKVSIEETDGILTSLTTKEIKETSLDILQGLMSDPEHPRSLITDQKGRISYENVDAESIRANALVGRVAAAPTVLPDQSDITLYALARAFNDRSRNPSSTLAEWERKVGTFQPLHGVRIAVEGSHTPSGLLTAAAFQALGAEVTLLHGDVQELEGMHKADPSKTENLRDLMDAMAAENIQMGMAFDLDGDRGAIVVRKANGEFSVLPPDNLLEAMIPFLLQQGGYDPRVIGKVAVIRDVLSTQGVDVVAKNHGVTAAQTDSGYVFLKALAKVLRQEGYTIPKQAERSGHAWLDVTGEFENPIAVAIIFTVMALRYREERPEDYFFYAYEHNTVPYQQSTRFQPAFHPEFLQRLADDPLNQSGWRYVPGEAPTQEIIAIGKHRAIEQALVHFSSERTFESPAGLLRVKAVSTGQDFGRYRFADIQFVDQRGVDAGRFVLRASANDPTFVASFETPVHVEQGEAIGSEVVRTRYAAVGAIVRGWMEAEKLSLSWSDEKSEPNTGAVAKEIDAVTGHLAIASGFHAPVDQLEAQVRGRVPAEAIASAHTQVVPTAQALHRQYLGRDRLGYKSTTTGIFSEPVRRDREAIARWIAEQKAQGAKALIHIGIGGQALGNRALMEAVGWAQDLEVVVLENVGYDIEAIFRDLAAKGIEPWQVIVHVSSKSGTTDEVALEFQRVLHALLRWLSPQHGEAIVQALKRQEDLTTASLADLGLTEDQQAVLRQALSQIIFTTTVKPDSASRLYKLATSPLARSLLGEQGIAMFAIPDNVGGRFSGRSPSGDVSSAFAGLDAARLNAGARELLPLLGEDLDRNPAMRLAWLFFLLEEQGLMDYINVSAPWQAIADHLAQLLPESDGKQGRGPFVSTSVGQAMARRRAESRVAGRQLNLIINVEQENGQPLPAITLEPSQRDRLQLIYTMKDNSPEELGKLFLFFEEATLWYGLFNAAKLGYTRMDQEGFRRVDPLDQPEVERAKRLLDESARALDRSPEVMWVRYEYEWGRVVEGPQVEVKRFDLPAGVSLPGEEQVNRVAQALAPVASVREEEFVRAIRGLVRLERDMRASPLATKAELAETAHEVLEQVRTFGRGPQPESVEQAARTLARYLFAALQHKGKIGVPIFYTTQPEAEALGEWLKFNWAELGFENGIGTTRQHSYFQTLIDGRDVVLPILVDVVSRFEDVEHRQELNAAYGIAKAHTAGLYDDEVARLYLESESNVFTNQVQRDNLILRIKDLSTAQGLVGAARLFNRAYELFQGLLADATQTPTGPPAAPSDARPAGTGLSTGVDLREPGGPVESVLGPDVRVPQSSAEIGEEILKDLADAKRGAVEAVLTLLRTPGLSDDEAEALYKQVTEVTGNQGYEYQARAYRGAVLREAAARVGEEIVAPAAVDLQALHDEIVAALQGQTSSHAAQFEFVLGRLRDQAPTVATRLETLRPLIEEVDPARLGLAIETSGASAEEQALLRLAFFTPGEGAGSARGGGQQEVRGPAGLFQSVLLKAKKPLTVEELANRFRVTEATAGQYLTTLLAFEGLLTSMGRRWQVTEQARRAAPALVTAFVDAGNSFLVNAPTLQDALRPKIQEILAKAEQAPGLDHASILNNEHLLLRYLRFLRPLVDSRGVERELSYDWIDARAPQPARDAAAFLNYAFSPPIGAKFTAEDAEDIVSFQVGVKVIDAEHLEVRIKTLDDPGHAPDVTFQVRWETSFDYMVWEVVEHLPEQPRTQFAEAISGFHKLATTLTSLSTVDQQERLLRQFLDYMQRRLVGQGNEGWPVDTGDIVIVVLAGELAALKADPNPATARGAEKALGALRRVFDPTGRLIKAVRSSAPMTPGRIQLGDGGAGMHLVSEPDVTDAKGLAELEEDARQRGAQRVTDPRVFARWAEIVESTLHAEPDASSQIVLAALPGLREQVEALVGFFRGGSWQISLEGSPYTVEVYQVASGRPFRTTDGRLMHAFGVRDSARSTIRLYVQDVVGLLHEGLEHLMGLTHTEAFFAEALIEGQPTAVNVVVDGIPTSVQVVIPSRALRQLDAWARRSSLEPLERFLAAYQSGQVDAEIASRFADRDSPYYRYATAMAAALHSYAELRRDQARLELSSQQAVRALGEQDTVEPVIARAAGAGADVAGPEGGEEAPALLLLLVNDDPATLDSLAKRLKETHGNTTVVTAQGGDAVQTLRTLEGGGARFNLVVLDLGTPRLVNGSLAEELISQLRELRPDLPIAVTSAGETAERLLAQFINDHTAARDRGISSSSEASPIAPRFKDEETAPGEDGPTPRAAIEKWRTEEGATTPASFAEERHRLEESMTVEAALARYVSPDKLELRAVKVPHDTDVVILATPDARDRAVIQPGAALRAVRRTPAAVTTWQADLDEQGGEAAERLNEAAKAESAKETPEWRLLREVGLGESVVDIIFQHVKAHSLRSIDELTRIPNIQVGGRMDAIRAALAGSVQPAMVAPAQGGAAGPKEFRADQLIADWISIFAWMAIHAVHGAAADGTRAWMTQHRQVTGLMSELADGTRTLENAAAALATTWNIEPERARAPLRAFAQAVQGDPVLIFDPHIADEHLRTAMRGLSVHQIIAFTDEVVGAKSIGPLRALATSEGLIELTLPPPGTALAFIRATGAGANVAEPEGSSGATPDADRPEEAPERRFEKRFEQILQAFLQETPGEPSAAFQKWADGEGGEMILRGPRDRSLDSRLDALLTLANALGIATEQRPTSNGTGRQEHVLRLDVAWYRRLVALAQPLSVSPEGESVIRGLDEVALSAVERAPALVYVGSEKDAKVFEGVGRPLTVVVLAPPPALPPGANTVYSYAGAVTRALGELGPGVGAGGQRPPPDAAGGRPDSATEEAVRRVFIPPSALPPETPEPVKRMLQSFQKEEPSG